MRFPFNFPSARRLISKGVIDLLKMKAYVFYDELGKDMREEEIPAGMEDLVSEYREKLMEAVSEVDDEIMELYLAGEEIPMDRVKAAIRKATIDNTMVPVTCGSSYKNKGVQEMLDAVVDLYALSLG